MAAWQRLWTRRKEAKEKLRKALLKALTIIVLHHNSPTSCNVFPLTNRNNKKESAKHHASAICKSKAFNLSIYAKLLGWSSRELSSAELLLWKFLLDVRIEMRWKVSNWLCSRQWSFQKLKARFIFEAFLRTRQAVDQPKPTSLPLKTIKLKPTKLSVMVED